MLQGYLRDVGMHIRNLQRSVNHMEELVDIEAQSYGIADKPGAPAIRIGNGEITFNHVTFHYGRHEAALYRDSRCGSKLAGIPAPARRPS